MKNLMILLLFLATTTLSAQRTLWVDENATGDNNGLTKLGAWDHEDSLQVAGQLRKGDVVIFMKGQYDLSFTDNLGVDLSGITGTGDRLTFIGYDADSTSLLHTSSGAGLDFAGYAGEDGDLTFEFRNFSIENSQHYVINLGTKVNLQISSCRVESGSRYFSTGAYNVIYYNSVIEDQITSALNVYKHVYVENCFFTGGTNTVFSRASGSSDMQMTMKNCFISNRAGQPMFNNANIIDIRYIYFTSSDTTDLTSTEGIVGINTTIDTDCAPSLTGSDAYRKYSLPTTSACFESGENTMTIGPQFDAGIKFGN